MRRIFDAFLYAFSKAYLETFEGSGNDSYESEQALELNKQTLKHIVELERQHAEAAARLVKRIVELERLYMARGE
jgi:hypothetical protein